MSNFLFYAMEYSYVYLEFYTNSDYLSSLITLPNRYI